MNATKLTARQQEILDYLHAHYRKEGVIPSTREIQNHFGFASQTAAMSHLRALERKGAIRRHENMARGIVFPEEMEREEIMDIPVYGEIAAGMAQDAPPEKEGFLSIDVASLGLPRRTKNFALKVRGDILHQENLVIRSELVLPGIPCQPFIHK